MQQAWIKTWCATFVLPCNSETCVWASKLWFCFRFFGVWTSKKQNLVKIGRDLFASVHFGCDFGFLSPTMQRKQHPRGDLVRGGSKVPALWRSNDFSESYGFASPGLTVLLLAGAALLVIDCRWPRLIWKQPFCLNFCLKSFGFLPKIMGFAMFFSIRSARFWGPRFQRHLCNCCSEVCVQCLFLQRIKFSLGRLNFEKRVMGCGLRLLCTHTI